MGTATHTFGRFVRTAAVAGLLGAAGLLAVASPAHAGTGGSDGASDGTDFTSSDGASDGASDGTSDGASDGSTDATDATDAADVGSTDLGTDADVGATDTSVTTSGGSLPITGGNPAVPLALGATAVGIVLVGRRLFAAQG